MGIIIKCMTWPLVFKKDKYTPGGSRLYKDLCLLQFIVSSKLKTAIYYIIKTENCQTI